VVATARHSRFQRTAHRVVVLITLLAFAMQAFVAQTHIHAAPQSIANIVKAASIPSNGKAPIDNSRENCPLCQAVAHAGAVLIPTAPLLLVPAWIEHFATFIAGESETQSAKHAWQSRAPPLR